MNQNDEHKTGSRARAMMRWAAGVLVTIAVVLAVVIPVVRTGITRSEQRTTNDFNELVDRVGKMMAEERVLRAKQADARWEKLDADLAERLAQDGLKIAEERVLMAKMMEERTQDDNRLLDRITEQDKRSGDTILQRIQAEYDKGIADLSSYYGHHVDAICTNDYWNTSLGSAVNLLIDHLDKGNGSLEDARAILVNGLQVDESYEKYSAVCGVMPDDRWVILLDDPAE